MSALEYLRLGSLPICLLLAPSAAQKPVLIKDLMTDPKPGYDASPEQLTVVGNALFFTAHTAATGRELFVSSGGISRPLLVKDLVAGARGSNPKALCELGGKLYFGFGLQLWVSDGTPAGTVRIATLNSDIQFIDRVGRRLVVRASLNLWFSDGTGRGTVRFQQLMQVLQLQKVGAVLWFSRYVGSTPWELWLTDGTVSGTRKVLSMQRPLMVGAFGKRILFAEGPPASLLWISDGTAKGTVSLGRLDASRGIEMAGKFYFTTRLPRTQSTQLHVTDGTAKGTKLVLTLTGAGNTYPVAAGANLLYLSSPGSPLWRSDGTTNGTFELHGGIDSRVPPMMWGNKLVFAASNWWTGSGPPWTGLEPWISDGTKNGTKLLKDIHAGIGHSRPDGFTALPGGFFAFSANDGSAGRELWVSFGAALSTWRVADLDPRRTPTKTSSLRMEKSHAGFALLRAGTATWVTDGTTSGTTKISDLGRSYVSSEAIGADILFGKYTWSGKAWRSALMRTDGTPGGTVPVRSFAGFSEPAALTRLGRYVYFAGGDSASGIGLWRTDGTPRGTVLVKNVLPYRMLAWRGALYFIAHNGTTMHLFRSDGTAAGTVPISGSFNPGPIPKLFKTQRHVYAPGMKALYRSDGTAAVKVQDRSGNTYLAALQLVEMGGVVYFLGSGRSGAGLWRTDGTPKGTYFVKGISVYYSYLAPDLTVVGKKLFFVEASGSLRHELWTSDGTVAGTRKVIGAPNRVHATRTGRTLAAVGDWLYFAADDGVNGSELWRTDGTTPNTKMVYDLAPGKQHSSPYGLLLSGGSLLFAADDGFHGHELFRIDVPAHVVPVGGGCAQGVIPKLMATPPQLNKSMTIDVVDASKKPGTMGLLAIGWPSPRPRMFGGNCTFYVDLNLPSFRIPFRPISGTWSIQLRVPGQAVLHGFNLSAQIATGPASQQPFGFDLSNGLLLALRR